MKVVGKLKGLVALFLVAAATVIAMPGSVSAASGNPSYCDPQVARLTNSNIGTEVPVIMVHGFQGHVSDWGSINNPSSFAGRVNNIPGVAVAHLFSYNTSVWVNDPGSGPLLGKTIDCVSQLSKHNGGQGKVIVVGYSMGGLVARDATGHMSSDGQRDIAEEVGQAITIGTPHTGTTLPNIGLPYSVWRGFISGSAELAILPHFSPNTVVHTIAGDVERVYYDAFNHEVRRDTPHDDTLVPVASAHAEATADASIGGGQKTITCQKRFKNLSPLPWYSWYRELDHNVPCEHKQLTNSASNGVREDTIDAIGKYVASLTQPVGASLTIGNLTTSYDNRWTQVEYGASGPGLDGSANDTTNGAPCTNCSDTPPPTVNAFIQFDNIARCQTELGHTLQQCAIGSSQVVGAAPPVTIGGRTPDYSARYLDSGYAGTSLVWCFDGDVCVHYRRAVDTPQLEPSQALLDVFQTATWTTPAA